jgi:hypothetical protein
VQLFGRPNNAAIRFLIENRSAATVEYHAGEQAWSLPSGASRTHTICNEASVSIAALNGSSHRFTATLHDGARYTVTTRGVLEEWRGD